MKMLKQQERKMLSSKEKRRAVTFHRTWRLGLFGSLIMSFILGLFYLMGLSVETSGTASSITEFLGLSTETTQNRWWDILYVGLSISAIVFYRRVFDVHYYKYNFINEFTSVIIWFLMVISVLIGISSGMIYWFILCICLVVLTVVIILIEKIIKLFFSVLVKVNTFRRKHFSRRKVVNWLLAR